MAKRCSNSFGIGNIVLPLLGLVVIGSPLRAEEWKISPIVNLTASYVDNIDLSPAGSEKSLYVFGVMPGVSVQREGKDLKVAGTYTNEFLIYPRDHGRDHSREGLQASANAALVPDFFYLDAKGLIAYQAADPSTPAATQTEVLTSTDDFRHRVWMVSPYIKRSLANTAVVTAGVDLDVIDNAFIYRDSFSRKYHVELKNGLDSPRTEWALNYARLQSFYKGPRLSDENEQITASLRYHLNTNWSFLWDGGRNHYTDPNDPLAAELLTGGYWRTGVGWTPNLQTIIDVEHGRHVFGTTNTGRVAVFSPHTALQFRYSEDITSSKQQQQAQAETAVTDPLKPPPTPPTDSAPVEVEQVFVSDKGELTAGVHFVHTALEVGGYRERRYFKTLSGVEIVRGRSLNARWMPTTRTTFSYEFSDQEFNFLAGRVDTQRDAKFELRRNFDPRLSGALEIHRMERTSTEATADYIAHLFFVRLYTTF